VGVVSKPQPTSLAHVLLPKTIFKPGENVHVKAWFRRLEYTPEGLPKLLVPSGEKIGWRVSFFFLKGTRKIFFEVGLSFCSRNSEIFNAIEVCEII
jgi:hypothetical protein